ESLRDAVIATDSAERITYLNPVAQAATGFTNEEAAGRPLREVFKLVGRDGGAIDSPVGRALKTHLAVNLPPDTLLVDRAGNRHLVDDAATPIIDDRGDLLGGVIVFRDITEQKRLERR